MALIDRVKFDGLRNRDWLVYKHPSESLVFGTQLIVGEGQAAIFVKSGQICDVFTAGTHTLGTQNLPVLQKILNLPFGGKTPFTAEVFFLNLVAKLDIHWGTSDPIQLVDPKYSTRLRVRAFGQMGLKVHDCAAFLRELVGVMEQKEWVQFDKLLQYYKGVVTQKIKVIIADIIINQKISALEIAPKMDEISEDARRRIENEFSRYGFIITNFYVKSINFPDEDFNEINTILQKRAEFEIIGDNRYVTARTLDVYETAAGNQGGAAGAMVAGGVGLGAGIAMGQQMPQMMTPPQFGGTVCQKCHKPNTSGAKFCNDCGMTLAVAEQKVACPHCSAQLVQGSAFCNSCGKSVKPVKCPECDTEVNIGVKFCHGCGKEVV
ncbi:MAG: SPFH domain-containing protein [Defluviitaleaceae bacterium]|nr:SPFH domain-containing protein [Defluviitaleaceae bacterium]